MGCHSSTYCVSISYVLNNSTGSKSEMSVFLFKIESNFFHYRLLACTFLDSVEVKSRKENILIHDIQRKFINKLLMIIQHLDLIAENCK